MEIHEILAKHEISLRSNSEGDHKTLCPKCSHTRRNKSERCLSVTIKSDGVLFNCHNCTWGGWNGINARPSAYAVRITPKREFRQW